MSKSRQSPLWSWGPTELLVLVLAGAGGGLTAMLTLPTAQADAASVCDVTSVHDGDTIRCGTEKVRILNIDAPELPYSPKCTDPRRNGWCDARLGYQSRDELRSFLSRGPVAIDRDGEDRYGRTLARLSVGGEDAGEHLIGLGLAKRWVE